MKLVAIFACSILAVNCVIAQAVPHTAPASGPAGISPEDLQKLAKDMEATAGKWLVATRYGAPFSLDPVDPEMDKRLAAAEYGEASLAKLKTCLTGLPLRKFGSPGSANGNATSVYIINQLLQPLKRARPEVIREMLPVAVALCKKFDFEDLPVWPPDRLRTFKPAGKTATLAEDKRVSQEQDKKLLKETEIARYNVQVELLYVNYFWLMSLAQDTKTDEKLVKMMVEYEAKDSILWQRCLTVLASIKDEARVKNLVNGEFSAAVEKMKWRAGSYTCKAFCQVSRTENSTFFQQPYYAGIEGMNVLNEFRKITKQPPLTVLTPDEIATHNAAIQKAEEARKKAEEARKAAEAARKAAGGK